MENEREELTADEIVIDEGESETSELENIREVTRKNPDSDGSTWGDLLDSYCEGENPLQKIANLRPYGEFFSDCGGPPVNLRFLARRMTNNYEYFSVNYKAIWTVLALYSIVFTPMLFFSVAFGVGYIVYKKHYAPSKTTAYVVLGKEITVTDCFRTRAVAALCAVLAVVTGASFVLLASTIFSLVLVLCHMIVHASKEERVVDCSENAY